MGGSVDANGDDPKARIAPGADHRALKDEEIADLYFKDGNYAGALGRYEEALSFAPDDEDAAFGVAECASKLGKRDEAIEAYKTYVKLAPQGKKANQARKAIQNLTSNAHH
jgi:tetratricopeptide (TPR) repeat protein